MRRFKMMGLLAVALAGGLLAVALAAVALAVPAWLPRKLWTGRSRPS